MIVSGTARRRRWRHYLRFVHAHLRQDNRVDIDAVVVIVGVVSVAAEVIHPLGVFCILNRERWIRTLTVERNYNLLALLPINRRIANSCRKTQKLMYRKNEECPEVETIEDALLCGHLCALPQ